MNDDLDQKSDAELNKIFAEEVAGWVNVRPYIRTRTHDGLRILKGHPDRQSTERRVPDFATDANAVLPWLEKWRYSDIYWNRITMLWQVRLQNGDHEASASTLARAAAIALIRGERGNRRG